MSLAFEAHEPGISRFPAIIPAAARDDLSTAFESLRFSLWRCSVEQYHEMVRAGILTGEDRVELLEGLIIQKMTKSPLHCNVRYRLCKAFETNIPGGFYVDSQDPVSLAESEPEPDAMIVRGDPEDFRERHPGLADVPVIAEIADSSLWRDKVLKKKLYAKNGIPVYWLVNLVKWRIEVYTVPTATAAGPNMPTAIPMTTATISL